MRPPETTSIDLEAVAAAEEAGAAFVVDLDGFEGPLHLLLSLARDQKVDLERISILKLADQYLDFVAQAKGARVELAADYLVMASWLAYLKSRILLPKPERPIDTLPLDDFAAHLAWRLKRLEAMRDAADALFGRPILGQDVFARGSAGEGSVSINPDWQADLIDLLRSYAKGRTRNAGRKLSVKQWPVYPIEEARRRIEGALPTLREWCTLGSLAPETGSFRAGPPSAASRYASLVSASLELAKNGRLQVQQEAAFGPVFVRATRDAGS